MLLPHKYMNLEKSILMMSSEIINEFLYKQTIEFETLYKLMEKRFGIDVSELFIPSLLLLHSLGKVEYIMNEDLLEWIE